MQTFHPRSGDLLIEVVNRLNFRMALMLKVTVQFEEPMDPSDPGKKEHATATIDGIPYSFDDLAGLTGLQVNAQQLDEWTECGIYFCGYHNPIDLFSIEFGEYENNMVPVVLKGVIDFTYEGLARLGKPEFLWKVRLNCDEQAFEMVCQECRELRK